MNTFPNGRYPPFGYNDNNQNRQHVPSNIYPPNGGRQGNPNSRFNELTTNTQDLMKNLPSMTNFGKAFEPNAPMIETIDYRNMNQLIHNNVGEIVIAESVVDYKINIDTSDRDICAYKDPFSFTVKFNPPSSSTIITEIKGKYKCDSILEKSCMKGPPRPHIGREFKNVKYIRLDNIVLPQYSNICYKDGEYILDPSSLLIDDRFIILRIKELDDDRGIRVYDTGDDGMRCDINGDCHQYPRPFGIIFPDRLMGKNYYRGTCDYANKIYKGSELGNITQLTFEFYDSCGKKLRFDHLCNDKKLPMCDVRNPLNKKIQIFMSFTIGVVEAQVNTNTKFEN